jgi:hypothetical protein
VRQDLSRSGLPANAVQPRLGQSSGHGVVPDKKLKVLYVDDAGLNAVEILKNKTWSNTGSITNGINGPDGNWVDKKGNLYVANYSGPYITEYAPGGSSPSFTYTGGISDPVGVSTDTKGNVFEADYLGGYVEELPQGSNSPTNTCYPGGNVEGVAVNSKTGDVFVDYNASSGGAKIVEYKGGLSGCSGTVLGVTLSFAGGMVLDKKLNIIVCDQLGPTVDVIKPPYSSVSGTLGSGYSDPFHVTINKKNNQAYVADYTGADVQVLKYPSGTNQATLNSANGLSSPFSAVDSLNFVP